MASSTREKATQEIFYVYVLLDTRRPGKYKYSYWSFNYEPFYVGKGHGRRMEWHVEDTTKSYKTNKIKKILLETGLPPEIKVQKEGMTEKEAFTLESRMVKAIGRINKKEGPLTNLTDGGDGAVGRIATKEQRERSRQVNLKRYQEASEEQKAIWNQLVSDAVRKTHANSTPEEKELRRKAMVQGFAAMSLKEKRRWGAAISAGNRKYWDSKTPEEMKEYSERKTIERANLS